MTKEDIKDFTLRISTANKCGLIVILYDAILTDIRAARKCHLNNDMAGFRKEVLDAGRFLNELISCLNFEQEMAYQFMRLYSYCNQRMAYALAGNHVEALNIIEEIITKLRLSFEKLEEQDKSGPMMQNTQAVYAGLTYGRGTLNETYVDPKDYNRGFSA